MVQGILTKMSKWTTEKVALAIEYFIYGAVCVGCVAVIIYINTR
jgi:hypothetical protein